VLNTAQSYSISAWVNLASTSTYSTAVSQGGATVGAFYLQVLGALEGLDLHLAECGCGQPGKLCQRARVAGADPIAL
jgi:hypothetical protein